MNPSYFWMHSHNSGIRIIAAGTKHPADASLQPGVEDRSTDVWGSLLAVADKAGGEWPDRARVACIALVAELRDGTPGLGVRLLTDLKGIFGGLSSAC